MENVEVINENIVISDEELIEKPHPIMAGIMDFYVYSSIIAGLVALIFSMIGKNIFLDNVLLLLAYIAVSLGGVLTFCLVYYIGFSKKINWLSFGERFLGRSLYEDGKHWINPYGINRVGIFIFIFIQLIMIGNNYDGISRGIVYDMPTLIGKIGNQVLSIYGLILIGKAKFMNGMIIFVIIHLMSTAVSLIINDSILFGIMIFLLVVDIVVLIPYQIIIKMGVRNRS